MKKIISVIIILIITTFVTINIIDNYKYSNKEIIESKIKNSNNHNNLISYMLEGETEGVYSEITSNAWPNMENYEFNSELSKCENGSKITWNNTTNKAEAYIVGTDSCYLYFNNLSLLPDPNNPLNLTYPKYWYSSFNGVYYSYPLENKSTDSGVTWTSGAPSVMYDSVESLQENGSNSGFSDAYMYIKTTETNHQVCVYYYGEYCIANNFWVSGDSDGSQTLTKLQNKCWNNYWYCSKSTTNSGVKYASCTIMGQGGLAAYENGIVEVSANSRHCIILNSGIAYCITS